MCITLHNRVLQFIHCGYSKGFFYEDIVQKMVSQESLANSIYKVPAD